MISGAQPCRDEVAEKQIHLPHLLHKMKCKGNEDTLLKCGYDKRLSFSSSSGVNHVLRYTSFPPAAIICQGNSSQPSHECTSGDVRLTNTMEGRVEICTSGMWVSVYESSAWTKFETYIFCKQLLGYPIPGSKLLGYLIPGSKLLGYPIPGSKLLGYPIPGSIKTFIAS